MSTDPIRTAMAERNGTLPEHQPMKPKSDDTGREDEILTKLDKILELLGAAQDTPTG